MNKELLSAEILEKLYVKERKSAAEIAKLLGCSEHKINYWLEKNIIPKRSLSEAIYVKKNPTGDPFSFIPPQRIEEAMLLGLGIGLYWGEGTRSNKNSIRLGNTDPRLVKKFMEFLDKLFKIKKEKLKFGLQIFSDMSPQKALKFWQKELKIPQSQFQKVIVTPARSLGTYRYKTKYGVLTIQYHNTKLRNIVCKMIEDMT